ncbi:MAG: hypothetical protein IJ764_04985 [Bacteroidales bacterium]|nr:hypothetical protein [Bacteroidales bacterium]
MFFQSFGRAQRPWSSPHLAQRVLMPSARLVNRPTSPAGQAVGVAAKLDSPLMETATR